MLSWQQRLATFVGLAGMLVLFCGGLYLVVRQDSFGSVSPVHPPKADRRDQAAAPSPPRILEGPPPELVLMLSGEMHGYLQPCGCSRPQVGGLDRRYQLWKQLRDRGWAVSAADLGDLAPRLTSEQGRIKFETALASLSRMRYAAVGLGPAELLLPLDQALGIALNYQPPYLVAANLNDADGAYPGMFRRWTLDQPGGPEGLRVAYVGIVGEGTAASVSSQDPALKFLSPDAVLPEVLAEIRNSRADLTVLLFAGAREEAVALAKRHPGFALVVTFDISDEPSAIPQEAHGAWFISLGHKGKYVGLVGVYRREGADAPAFDLKYQLVSLSPHFEVPADQTNPVREELRDYVLRIYQGEFLQRYPKGSHPVQAIWPEARYAGAEACKDCHKKAYAVWSQSKHAKAYENLVKYGEPVAVRERKGQEPQRIGRQFDPDCVRCHTTGFEYKTGFVSEAATPHLLGNQCENCHGPASLHVADPKNPEYYRPLRLALGKQVENQVCRKCHDGDNDPRFDLELYWPQIRHTKD
jgi:hypothetical protein